MLLKNNAWWGETNTASILLGIYEKQVLDVIFLRLKKKFDIFVNIGAANGYYAIGLLVSKKALKSICFEMSDTGRNTIRENANLNNVMENIEILGKAEESFVNFLPQDSLDKALVLCDIEGGEFEIFTKRNLQKLSESIIILEIHNWIADFWEKYEEFLYTASKIFNIESIPITSRNIEDFEELNGFADENRMLICAEGRANKMRYLLLTPK